MTELEWLICWFKKHCDGDWEHTYGITIETLDNFGWKISISLEETELENIVFKKLKIERSVKDWINCFIKDNCFEIECGLMNFEEGLKTFRNWVENLKKDF
jgi:hypothetical protein